MDTTRSGGSPSAAAWSALHAATTVVPPEPHSRYESALGRETLWRLLRKRCSVGTRSRPPGAGRRRLAYDHGRSSAHHIGQGLGAATR
eukprot:scaffold31049_cov64-Phaeocystis_antarctica.AAC.1